MRLYFRDVLSFVYSIILFLSATYQEPEQRTLALVLIVLLFVTSFTGITGCFSLAIVKYAKEDGLRENGRELAWLVMRLNKIITQPFILRLFMTLAVIVSCVSYQWYFALGSYLVLLALKSFFEIKYKGLKLKAVEERY